MPESEPPHGRRLVTPYAFIDTEAFRAAGMDWHSRTWKSLVEIAGDGTLRPLTTSITAREVEARLTEALLEAEAAAKKHASVFGQLGDGEPLGSADPADRGPELHRKFRKFLKKAKFDDIPIEVDLGSVLDDYFAGAPPFGEGKKKSEFPDAFVVSSLLAWLRPGRPRMYVVSKDPDMVRSCAGADGLIHLGTVAELLSLALASSELLARLDAHVRGDRSMLEGLRRQLNAYRPRRASVEVEDIEFFDIEIESVLLVDESEDGAEFVLEVGVVAQVEIEVEESGHEYVISHRGEPDIGIKTHRARPNTTSDIYLEVVVAASGDDGATLETTDWTISSGEIEVRLPREFSVRTVRLEPR